jgi:hypothetical protein
VKDRWVWKIHYSHSYIIKLAYNSHNYIIKSTYNYLTAAEIVPNEGYNHLLWLKVLPLKGQFFCLAPVSELISYEG